MGAPAKKRNLTIDTAKFLLILSIFVFHYGTAAGGWYPLFGAFHVPAFFMVSGFWALNRMDRSVWWFIKNAFQKYLLLWLCFVLIYPVFYTLTEGYGWRTAWMLFVRYLCAVRESGIGGMWFVPAFFLVSLCYFLTAKVIAHIPRLGQTGQAWLNLLIALGVLLVYQQLAPSDKRLLFSLDQVPLHWFFYALGRVVYSGYLWLKTRGRGRQTTVLALSAVISLGYMTMMYYHIDDRLWGGVGKAFPLLPQTAGVMLSLCGVFWVARAIQCRFLVRIGQSTLGLCLCEQLAKAPFTKALELLEVSLTAAWMPFVLSLAALLVGCFIVLPPIEWTLSRVSRQVRALPT